MKQFDTLEETISFLYHHGEEADFTKNGLPTVCAVNRLYAGGKANAQAIEVHWRRLYGFSRYRKHYQRKVKRHAR